MSMICEQLTTNVGALFTCSPVNDYIRIRTPFLYPDGDVIDLFYKEEEGFATLTDLGETLRWLRMQTMSQRKSVKQRQLINDICLNHGIEFHRGMLTVRLKQGAEWHDLSNWSVGPEAVRFISLFDDTIDVWSDEDYRLVKEISEVAYWSRRDEFLEKLAA